MLAPRGQEDAVKVFLQSLWRDESGQGLTEYALIIALVAVALIATLVLFRNAIGGVFTDATGKLNNAPNAPAYNP